MTTINTRLFTFAVVAICLTATTHGSEPATFRGLSQGRSSGPGSCRVGPATYRVVSNSGSFTSTINGTCTFNASAVESTCTNQYTDSAGQSITSISVTRHANRGLVVDEVAVIPPLNKSLSTTTTVTGSNRSTGTATQSYDGQGRILSTVSTTTASGATTTATTTFTSWDSAGRPTASRVQGRVGPAVSNTFSYDNTSRTQVSTNAGVTCTQVFDVNGNPTSGTCSNGATTTFTTLSTFQVCR